MDGVKKELHVKEVSETGDLSYEYATFIRDLRSKVKTDDSDRASWKTKMLIASNQRLGIKRYSNYPYPGAPDIPLPETDKLIKKALPNLVLSSYSPKKKAIVTIKQGVQETPDLKEKQKAAEDALNMVLDMPEIGLFKKLLLAADNLKQYGHCVFRVFEEFKTRWVYKVLKLSDYPEEDIEMLRALSDKDLKMYIADRFALDQDDDNDASALDDIIRQFRKGDETIGFHVERIDSYPQVEVIDPLRIIVPAYTTDINKAQRITYEFYLSKEQLEGFMETGRFRKKDLAKDVYPQGQSSTDFVDSVKNRNEGISDNTSQKDLFRIHEICFWYKGQNDKYAKRRVVTVLADVLDIDRSLLQDIEFPYEFDGWFYEKADNETKDTRYYSSRGLPEQIRALQEISERCINNLIIRDEFNNTPMWEVLDTSEIMDAHVRMTPGQKLPVKQLGQEVAPLNKLSSVDMSSERMMALLKAYTEEYQASGDQLFRNATNSGGGKTLGEIQVGMQQNSGPLNLEIIAWNDVLSKVYTKMFQIMAERMNESLYIEGKEVTKEHFNFPADIRSNGSVEVSNVQLATQKAWFRLQAITNPAFMECVNADDKYAALQDWLEKDGVKNPDQFCTDPKEMAQEVIVQMQNQIKQMQQALMMMQKKQSDGVKQLEQQKDAEKESRDKMEYANQMTVQAGQQLEAVGNELFSART